MARGREIQLKSLLYARYDYLARTRGSGPIRQIDERFCVSGKRISHFLELPNFRTFEGIFLLVFALHFSLPTRENSFPHRFQFSRFIQSSCAIVVRFLRHLLYSRRRQKYRDRLLFHVFSSRVAGQQVFKLTVSFLEFTRDKRGQREPRKDIWDKEEGRTRRCWPPRLRRSILVRDRHRKKELDSLFLPLSPWCPITRI